MSDFYSCLTFFVIIYNNIQKVPVPKNKDLMKNKQRNSTNQIDDA